MNMPRDCLKWVEVSAAALRHNLGEFRRLVPASTALMAVVKSNAYGHGMVEVARLAVDAGADWLGVNELDEGLALRAAGLEVPVLVMGAVPTGRAHEAALHSLRCVAYDRDQVAAFGAAGQKAGRPLLLHIKLETGLNRQGVAATDLIELARAIDDDPFLELDGLSTHFANIEDTTDHTFAKGQLERFEHGLATLTEHVRRPAVAHCACSAAALVVRATSFDMVRVGIGMYGLWPSKETQLSAYMQGADAPPTLRPVMTWKTRIAQVKRVGRGESIGYGCTERATHDLRLAVLPVGYFDGADRRLSNQGQVLVRGQRAYVRGRVCMNMLMVDVTHLPEATAGDEVVLLGSQGDETVSAEFIASQLGTINYEVVTGVGAHLPRVVVD